jgi:hypothetical protein
MATAKEPEPPLLAESATKPAASPSLPTKATEAPPTKKVDEATPKVEDSTKAKASPATPPEKPVDEVEALMARFNALKKR